MSKPEDGVAVVMALGLSAVLVVVALLGSGAGAVISAHRRVQAAADLAALAAARGGAAGEGGCGAAQRVAERNGGVLERCELAGSVATVAVSTALPGWLGDRSLRAVARAGPG